VLNNALGLTCKFRKVGEVISGVLATEGERVSGEGTFSEFYAI